MNFRYNFAFVFKRLVFICLGVLILGQQLPENLVQTTCPYKVVQFPRLFLAKETRLLPPSREEVQPTSVQKSVDSPQRPTARMPFRKCELFLCRASEVLADSELQIILGSKPTTCVFATDDSASLFAEIVFVQPPSSRVNDVGDRRLALAIANALHGPRPTSLFPAYQFFRLRTRNIQNPQAQLAQFAFNFRSVTPPRQRRSTPDGGPLHVFRIAFTGPHRLDLLSN